MSHEAATPRGGERPAGYWRRVWRRYRRSRLGMAGFVIVGFLLLLGLLAPALANEHEHPLACRYAGKLYFPALHELAWNVPGLRQLWPKPRPFNQVTFDLRQRLKPERGDWAIWTPVAHSPIRTTANVLAPPSRRHLLGTDEVGRDVLARMIHGARVSMMVGFVSIGISTVLGLFLGALAGFFGGKTDMVISRAIEIVQCFPVFFLILSIMAWRPPSIWNVMVVIGLTRWTPVARYVRGEFVRLRDADYAVAAAALGARNGRIIFRHILPNALAPVFVTVTFGIASAILIEAGLSWLGFGVMPPQASWGSILRAGFDNIFTTAHLVYPPCVAVFLAVLGYNLVGDTLRDATDPRLASR